MWVGVRGGGSGKKALQGGGGRCYESRAMGAMPLHDITLENVSSIPRLGLLAGEGRFPYLIAHAAGELGIPVTAFAMNGITPQDLTDHVDAIHWMELGQFSEFIDQVHADGIEYVIMAGRVPHNSIWRYRGFDRRSLRLLGKMVTRRADSILGTVVEELESEHIHVLDSSLFLRKCMPGKGVLTPGRVPTSREEKDIEFGFPLARQIAGMDIGQTIVVKDLAVVAVESLEGTDETIKRAGRIADGDIVAIKVCKPHQDSRFDIPVVGPGTLKSMAKAGGGTLAFMAGEVLFFDQEEALKIAAEANICVIAI